LLLAGLVVLLFAPVLFLGTGQLFGRDLHLHRSWELHNRRALLAGQIPYWNPFLFAGMPSMAHVESAFFYPFSYVLLWMPVDRLYAWSFALHAWLTGVGGYLLSREAGAGRRAALFGAVGLTAGGFVAPRVFAGHASVVYGWTWLPWALAFAIRHRRGGGLWPHPGLVVALALQFLSGWVQGSLYTAAAVGFYFLFAAAGEMTAPGGVRRPGRPLIQITLIAVAFVGVIAVQLFATMEFINEAGRSAGADLQYAAGGNRSLSLDGAVSAMAPRLEGRLGPTYTDSPYVGSLLLLFAPFAFMRRENRRLAMFFGLLAMVSMALAAGRHLPLYQVHLWLFPGLRIPLRFIAFWAVSVVVLGSLGLDALEHSASDSKQGRRRAAVALALIAMLAYGAIFARAASQPDAAGFLARVGGSWFVGLVQVASAGLIAGLVYAGVGRASSYAATALLAVEVLAFSSGYVRGTSAVSSLAAASLQGLPVGRVLTLCENAVSPTQLMDAGYPNLDGYAALTLAGYARYGHLVLGQGVPETLEAPRLGASRRLPARRDLLDALNVTHILSCEALVDPGLTLVRRVESVLVYQNVAAWPRAVWMCPQEAARGDATFRRLAGAAYDADRILRPQPPQLIVRWAPGMSDPDRQAKERQYRLASPWSLRPPLWRYDVLDGSERNLSELLRDPAVESTRAHGEGLQRPIGAIDELFGRLVLKAGPPPPDRRHPELAAMSLIAGSRACPAAGAATIRSQDTAAGALRVSVEAPAAGVLVTSEPYYPARVASVDGRPTATIRVNGAFIGVPVPPGRHDVQLLYDRRRLYAGAAVSLFSVVLLALGWRRRSAPTGQGGS
jgi:hypothetical protein